MDKKFRIDQLRKDKMIYALEAIATSLACILGIFVCSIYLSGEIQMGAITALLAVAIGYTIFMGLGNWSRLKEIKKLEAEL